MIPKLTLREKWLYRRKKYDALSKLMKQAEGGAARFNKLCTQDASLQTWLGRTRLMMSAAIRNPKFSAALKEKVKRDGQGKLFDLYKSLDDKGFVTTEEAAAAFGMTVEEMKATVAAYPAMFKEWHISSF